LLIGICCILILGYIVIRQSNKEKARNEVEGPSSANLVLNFECLGISEQSLNFKAGYITTVFRLCDRVIEYVFFWCSYQNFSMGLHL